MTFRLVDNYQPDVRCPLCWNSLSTAPVIAHSFNPDRSPQHPVHLKCHRAWEKEHKGECFTCDEQNISVPPSLASKAIQYITSTKTFLTKATPQILTIASTACLFSDTLTKKAPWVAYTLLLAAGAVAATRACLQGVADGEQVQQALLEQMRQQLALLQEELARTP